MSNSSESGDLWLGLCRFESDGSFVIEYEGSVNGAHPRTMYLPVDGTCAWNGPVPNSDTIGTDVLGINLYTQSSMPLDPTQFSILVVMPDGSFDTFSGEIGSAIGIHNYAVNVTKSGTSAPYTYIFSEL